MPQPNKKPMLRGDDYRWQVDPTNPKRPVRGSVLNSLKAFLTLKRQNPMQPYGSSDKPFRSDGFFANEVPGIAHAHITHDLSVVYKMSGGVLHLFGIYSHDQLGTGQPQNVNKQKSMAAKFSNMKFSE